MTQDDELLDVAEAKHKLLINFSALDSSVVTLAECVGRVLAEPVFASINFPPFTNSAMDGFAVRAEDLAGADRQRPISLDVIADVPAGEAPTCIVRSGQAARIMTGAPLPQGANAVVPIEITDFDHRRAGVAAPDIIRVYQSVNAGDYLRPVGQDVKAGELVMPAGTKLHPQNVGFLSMLGITQVLVSRKPKLGIISTGDELISPGAPLTPGKIYNSNSPTLAALVLQSGGEALVLGTARDNHEAVHAILDSAVSAGCDLILTTAGVSVGAMDYVRNVVEDKGEVSFWRVNMRPGKPILFGKYKQIPFIGLPGNPVSAFVGFVVFVRPAINKMLGLKVTDKALLRADLLEPVFSDGRESYLRGIVEIEAGRLKASLTGHQGSGNLRSLVQANALLLIPSGVKYLPSGDQVEVLLLGEIF